jgi:hypothetical protein
MVRLAVGFAVFFVAVLLLAVFVFGRPFWVFASSEVDAQSAIVAAENRIFECYGALLGADEAGANMTGLLVKLNEAGALLSKADLAYTEGNFDSAVDFAVQSSNILDGFVEEASLLKEAAAQQHYLDFMVNVVGSGVGAVCVLVGGFALWTFLKRREKAKGRGLVER